LEEGAQGTDYTYTEQIIWRNADTGNILAESDFFPAMSPGILVTPGYGRIIYEMLYNGHSRIIEERYIGPEYNLDEMLKLPTDSIGYTYARLMSAKKLHPHFYP
jgi:hypothetical protein